MFKFKKSSLAFILIFGLISLFADITYEGARSITGPFLGSLAANAAIIATVAGFGEMLGYVLRLFSGYFIDRTALYWGTAILGYAINLLAMPALALVNSWQWAAFFIILERTGKAIRIPARDVMISYATHEVGRGKGFGIHEAMDKVGAMLGPLFIAVILYFQLGYRLAFASLLFPAFFALVILFWAKFLYPNPQDLERAQEDSTLSVKLTKNFWLFLAASACLAAGFADFALIAFHFEKKAIFTKAWVPLSYAIAMGVSAISALGLGVLYDKKGSRILIYVIPLICLFAPLVFLGSFYVALLGIALWGVGMGVQASIMRAIVAKITHSRKRGLAFGLFNASFGIAWFIGSVILGHLYELHIMSMVIFSVAIQLLAIPFIFAAKLK